MDNIPLKLILTSLILSGIGSTHIEAVWLRNVCSRTVAVVRNNRKKLSVGTASAGFKEITLENPQINQAMLPFIH